MYSSNYSYSSLFVSRLWFSRSWLNCLYLRLNRLQSVNRLHSNCLQSNCLWLYSNHLWFDLNCLRLYIRWLYECVSQGHCKSQISTYMYSPMHISATFILLIQSMRIKSSSSVLHIHNQLIGLSQFSCVQ